jgi:3',5'-cyclic AMP phosphodiesterase CpdA
MSDIKQQEPHQANPQQKNGHEDRNLVRILHISDLHFGPPFVPEVAEALLDVAAKLTVDAVVVSGDLTQRATRGQFEEAARYLERLPAVPKMVIPGNHDVPLYNVIQRFTNPLQRYREIISEELNPVLELPHAILVGLDTTAPRTAISNGRISSWQLEQCAQVLSRSDPAKARIVVAHHHFAPAPDYLEDSSMPKAKRAIERFVELEVDLILGGHLHRAYIGNTLDFFPGDRRDRGIVIAQSGTSTSRRGRGREEEKNTFNLVHVNRRSIVVTHYLYFHDTGFVELSTHQFFRPNVEWQRSLRA